MSTNQSKAKRKKINSRSAKQERKYAEEVGGKVQAGSGCSPRAPEDVVEPLDDGDEGFLTQIKFTDSKGYRITVDEWKRIERNARRLGREPKLLIEFPGAGVRIVVTNG